MKKSKLDTYVGKKVEIKIINELPIVNGILVNKLSGVPFTDKRWYHCIKVNGTISYNFRCSHVVSVKVY